MSAPSARARENEAREFSTARAGAPRWATTRGDPSPVRNGNPLTSREYPTCPFGKTRIYIWTMLRVIYNPVAGHKAVRKIA
ncbi:MAG TPA: hypothetical protein VIU83_05115, partial [Candidatus Deferrimicrobium sp.]